MSYFVVLREGDPAGESRPVVASNDPRIVAGFVRLIAERVERRPDPEPTPGQAA